MSSDVRDIRDSSITTEVIAGRYDPIIEIMIVVNPYGHDSSFTAPAGWEFVAVTAMPPAAGGSCGGTFYPEQRIIWGRRASVKALHDDAKKFYNGLAEDEAKMITERAQQGALKAAKDIKAVEMFLSIVEKDYTPGREYYYYKTPQVSPHYQDPLFGPERCIESTVYRGVMWQKNGYNDPVVVVGEDGDWHVNTLKANLATGDWDTQIPLLSLYPTRDGAIESGRERHAEWQRAVREAKEEADREIARVQAENRAARIEEARRLLEQEGEK